MRRRGATGKVAPPGELRCRLANSGSG